MMTESPAREEASVAHAADARPKVGFIVGPTGAGKTAIAIAVAERIGAEIVNADSRQLYRTMDLGTAKPSPEELRRVAHHLIDIRDPDVRRRARDEPSIEIAPRSCNTSSAEIVCARMRDSANATSSGTAGFR